MKYTISAVKKTAIPKRDGSGTWTKIEVKTKETGDKVYELGAGISKQVNENIKAGFVIEGYTESVPWMKSDGTPGGFNHKLNGLTVEYLYTLIQGIIDRLDGNNAKTPAAFTPTAVQPKPVAPVSTGWEGEDVVSPEEEINPDDIGF